MSAYLALARRWRPQHFDDFVGQEAVVAALRHALDSGRIHHAFLFTGTRGVGKTTLARLLAKCLNCERGVSSNPCGECSACRSIAAGNFVDLLEVDAASRTRVDETRDLMDNVQYAPTVGRYKVYLIDEVHMLSTHSFNALLKTLEEPPEHVKFLLATTDPQKLPVTVLSRCLQFNLRRLDIPQIQGRLQQIMAAEQIPAEDAALQILSRAADGSLRDALSLLDQAIVHGGGAVQREGVLAMLGRSSDDAVLGLVEALVDRDATQVFAILDDHLARGMDGAGLLDLVIEGVHRLSLAQFLPVDSARDDAPVIARLRGRISPLTLQSWYFLLLSARRDFALYPDSRMALEMAMLRVLGFSGAVSPDLPPAVLPGPGTPHVVESSAPTAEVTSPASHLSAPSLSYHSRDAVREAPPLATSDLPDRVAETAPSTDWRCVVEALAVSPMLAEYLRHGQALRCDSEAVELAVEPNYLPFLVKAEARRALHQALTAYFGREPRLSIVPLTKAAGVGSLVQEEKARAASRQAEAAARVTADPRIGAFLEVLEAQVESIEIMVPAANGGAVSSQ
ncbi:DNA polymerase III, subunits gamma and tau [Acidithiobacillus ferrivorans]|uniref:DNA polymerase III subunit gamma/tau n=1 Tax=Acidithiobacillus ferrivorans TaxID=160808 RepID=A0A060UNS8_9PROT|nr:DNA polymerase III subunit gamma/tau [Acidithiobacillus ferrivorans]CDQ10085.1 DNA polymerase III, subunits gamma and tau [Acidithiobacillus ferrivorans]SMH64046.1 DNA polymerase III, subunits gamma and tau [Acidithiobacillus ferrivorans]